MSYVSLVPFEFMVSQKLSPEGYLVTDLLCEAFPPEIGGEAERDAFQGEEMGC